MKVLLAITVMATIAVVAAAVQFLPYIVAAAMALAIARVVRRHNQPAPPVPAAASQHPPQVASPQVAVPQVAGQWVMMPAWMQPSRPAPQVIDAEVVDHDEC